MAEGTEAHAHPPGAGQGMETSIAVITEELYWLVREGRDSSGKEQNLGGGGGQKSHS